MKRRFGRYDRSAIIPFVLVLAALAFAAGHRLLQWLGWM